MSIHYVIDYEDMKIHSYNEQIWNVAYCVTSWDIMSNAGWAAKD